MQVQEFSRVVTDVYDAAMQLGRWRRALDGVADASGARAIALVVRQPEPTAGQMLTGLVTQMKPFAPEPVFMSGAYLKFSRGVNGKYYGFVHAREQQRDWDFLERQTPRHPVPDTANGQTPEELDRRGDYEYLRRHVGVRRRVGIRLNADSVRFDAMSIGFSTEVEVVPPSALETVLNFVPHIVKSVEMARIFSRLELLHRAVIAALDHVLVGLVLVRADGSVMVRNAEAQRIFDLDDGVRKGPDGRLVCLDPDQSAALNAMIAETALTARGEGAVAERLIAIGRKSPGTRFIAETAPLRTPDDGPGDDGVLVTLIDPDRVPLVKLGRFIRLYGLTQAEADVTRLIFEGLTVEEIGERRGTSPRTAKNQVSAILGKFGVDRRTELIRLFLRVLPPVI